MYFSSHPFLNVKTMNTQSQDFEFDPLRSATVTLSAEAVDWAAQVSRAADDLSQQWQGFLRALALQGFQQWLGAGALDVAAYFDRQQLPPAGVNCWVGDFRLCLIPQGSLNDEWVHISRDTVESDQFAHLYVLVEVQEEAERVTILGGLRCDRISSRQSQLVPNPDGTYTIPIQHFDASPEEILLYLNCLQPAALTQAVAAPPQPAPQSPSPQPGALINVGRWLRDQVDAVAASLAWTLMPPTPAAMGLRSPTETLEDMLSELGPSLAVPSTARGAYTDFQQFGLPFRLYALTWTLYEGETPEWSLLLLLGPSDGGQLPPGIRLIVSDQNAVLTEQTLAAEADSTYLYAQVIGTWDEQFTATVQMPNGANLTWPPFAYNPDA